VLVAPLQHWFEAMLADYHPYHTCKSKTSDLNEARGFDFGLYYRGPKAGGGYLHFETHVTYLDEFPLSRSHLSGSSDQGRATWPAEKNHGQALNEGGIKEL